MTEFGLACVFGGLAFAFTLIPAVGYLLNFGVCNKRPEEPKNLINELETYRFRNSLIRDMSFTILSCFVYYLAMSKGSLSLACVCV